MADNQVLRNKKYRENANKCAMQVDRAMRDRFEAAADKLGMSKAAAFELATKNLERKCKNIK